MDAVELNDVLLLRMAEGGAVMVASEVGLCVSLSKDRLEFSLLIICRILPSDGCLKD